MKYKILISKLFGLLFLAAVLVQVSNNLVELCVDEDSIELTENVDDSEEKENESLEEDDKLPFHEELFGIFKIVIEPAVNEKLQQTTFYAKIPSPPPELIL